jgi:hypothetical protein
MSHKIILFITLTLLVIVAGTWSVYAGTQQAYVLQRSVVGSASAGTLRGSGYALNATVGQPVVGISSAPGSFGVSGGYPNPVPLPEKYNIYLPLIMRQV